MTLLTDNGRSWFSILCQYLFRGITLKKLLLFLKAFFLDLLKCIYCQIIVSVYMIPYCLPVRFLVCSQVLFAIFFSYSGKLHWPCIITELELPQLGKLGCVPFCASRDFSVSLRPLLQSCHVSSTLDIQGPHLGESSPVL